MQRTLWVDARPYRKELVTAALESGADAVMIDQGHTDDVKVLGLIKTIAADGDLVPGADLQEVTINNKDDEEQALKAPASMPIIVHTSDWKVIPLENLIASRSGIIACVKNSEEARLALEIMERGADGLFVETDNPAEIKKIGALFHDAGEKLELVPARITKVDSLGMGDRVCVDTITNMDPGQGLLVGNSSSGMFLVHAENVETPYCDTRPFRVNAGAVHAYVRVPGGKTKYLADLASGSPVLIVDYSGKTLGTNVGRSKVEKRPMLLVEALAAEKPVALVLQNAETIRLTRADGSPVSITSLKPGDEVLAFVETAGRHFGVKVEESIKEK